MVTVHVVLHRFWFGRGDEIKRSEGCGLGGIIFNIYLKWVNICTPFAHLDLLLFQVGNLGLEQINQGRSSEFLRVKSTTGCLEMQKEEGKGVEKNPPQELFVILFGWF